MGRNTHNTIQQHILLKCVVVWCCGCWFEYPQQHICGYSKQHPQHHTTTHFVKLCCCGYSKQHPQHHTTHFVKMCCCGDSKQHPQHHTTTHFVTMCCCGYSKQHPQWTIVVYLYYTSHCLGQNGWIVVVCDVLHDSEELYHYHKLYHLGTPHPSGYFAPNIPCS